MTTFLRILGVKDKASALMATCMDLRAGQSDERLFEIEPKELQAVPGTPFSYWVSRAVRETFQRLPSFESSGRTAKVGLATADDFRFLRTWWEIDSTRGSVHEFPSFAKGGSHSPYYSDLSLVLNWKEAGAELKQTVIAQHGNAGKRVYNEEYYFRPAITWPLRAHKFSPQALPAECIFSVRGYTAHTENGDHLGILGIFNSAAFDYLFKSALGRFGYPEFIVGILQLMPWPTVTGAQLNQLSDHARVMWSKKRILDTTAEVSHAFTLPTLLRNRAGHYDPPAIGAELAHIQTKIDAIAFDLYGFSEADRAIVQASQGAISDSNEEAVIVAEGDDEDSAVPVDHTDGLLSWAVGVAFGRFDWRLATGERAAPPEPEPFDALPPKSPGMLPDGAAPFHPHAGILVDDAGHLHDLAHLAEEVLVRVDSPVPADLRRWLQKDFFPFHLQRYSKSRRKAPIYWPLSTVSGGYTLWVYYPSLSHQTLYTAINDFVEPKLKQVGDDVAGLRSKGNARTRDDEKQFEALQTLAQELSDMRDTLQVLAHTYQPNHDDGVQITSAPLRALFRHKPWQKVLNETWTKLQKGDYDWAHLAIAYWPERVREKCKTDKSLAIAHGLEDLYIEPEAAPKKTRRKTKAGGEE
ncbi:MAG: type II restriction endonuclease subunit M [Burkholderiales bacterium RIFCSPLOWO2_12_FULL_61_40]|nr:MAG: type II restriction endonuclease subunit M [Burkholderiales bacterium RIFCSPLOWO2_12_FULL_61_40]